MRAGTCAKVVPMERRRIKPRASERSVERISATLPKELTTVEERAALAIEEAGDGLGDHFLQPNGYLPELTGPSEPLGVDESEGSGQDVATA